MTAAPAAASVLTSAPVADDALLAIPANVSVATIVPEAILTLLAAPAIVVAPKTP